MTEQGKAKLHQAWLKIAMLITENPPLSSNDLQDVVCPVCGEAKLHFSFSVIDPQMDRYGLFIVCENKDTYLHYNLTGKPLGFDSNLIEQYYQDIETKVTLKTRHQLGR